MNNLHPAAKMKRIISACDFWFSEGNLKSDEFLRIEISEYRGFVRISALKMFPKFQGWATGRLICEALQSEAARSRYRVVFNKEVVEKVAINRQRRLRRREKEEKEEERKRTCAKKEHKKRRKKRIKELQMYVDQTRAEFFLPIWKEMETEHLEWEQGELEKEKQEEQKRLEEEWKTLDLTQKTKRLVAQNLANAKEWISQLTSCSDAKTLEEERNIDNMTEKDIDWLFYDSHHELELCEENPKFQEAVIELEDLEYERDREWQDDRWDQRMDREIEQMLKRERQHAKKDVDEIKELGLEDDKTITDDEVLPYPIEDDGSNVLQYALVKHKKSKDRLRELNVITEEEHMDLGEYGDDHLISIDEWGSGEEEEEEVVKPKKTKKKQISLKKYSSERKVEVIHGNVKKLEAFCQRLTQSLERSQIKAIGMDVEYCSLEMDIRTTLPAMLQLASPEPNGPVGLIWLDKFPNHGKNMIFDDSCKDLLSILNNHEISKVGVRVSEDAKHLAEWWGITDPKYASFYFSGMVDMEKELEDTLSSKSLQEMVAAVLERDLPKLKEKNAQRKKEQRKKGKRVKTSHWRRDNLTKEMKQYAVDDVSSAIDVWLKVKTKPDDGDAEEEVGLVSL